MRVRVGVFLALLVAIVACTSGPDDAPSADHARLVDDYIAAWNDYDGTAVRSMVTDDFEYVWFGRTVPVNEITSYVADKESSNFSAETTDGPVWASDVVVEVAMVLRSDDGRPGPDGMDTVSTLTIVEQGDDLLVARHEIRAEGTSSAVDE